MLYNKFVLNHVLLTLSAVVNVFLWLMNECKKVLGFVFADYVQVVLSCSGFL